MINLSRILKEHQRRGEKIVSMFLTLGYPSLRETEWMILDFEKLGVQLIELGFPFSDPLADGPTIQFSSDCALRKGVCFQDALRLMKRVRRKGCQIPIVFFSYFNPIHHHGVVRVAKDLKEAGFQGLIIPDLPPDHATSYRRVLRRYQLSQIHLVAPTTERKRMQWIVQQSLGFVYYVSLRGVTGARKSLDRNIQKHIKILKRATSKPILVGFGVSTPKQVRQICHVADGVIVGSALIRILKNSRNRHVRVRKFVKSLVSAAKLS